MYKLNWKETALLSVDNTRTFEDKTLNELYVNEGEVAAQWTLDAIWIIKRAWWLIYNVFETHPIWHISLAWNYQNKKPFETITFDEVKVRTDENNWLSERAGFTVWELKWFLSMVGTQMLWPDHAIKWKPWIELTKPLKPDMFDRTIIKWDLAKQEEYSWFTNWKLIKQLQDDWIKNIVIGWVAIDYCIWDTAKDAQMAWYNTFIISDAVRWVATNTTQNKIKELTNLWVKFITIQQLSCIFTN